MTKISKNKEIWLFLDKIAFAFRKMHEIFKKFKNLYNTKAKLKAGLKARLKILKICKICKLKFRGRYLKATKKEKRLTYQKLKL